MTHKNSKDPKYIHNNPIWAQNGPKGAQMRSHFNKMLPVMHVSVRHDLFYNFSSDAMNVKNKEKNPVFCSPLSKGF